MAKHEKNLQGKTKNGLQYYILPQNDFGDKMAAIVVKRGANYLFWKGKNGEEIVLPQGTAHFIEHKLFQQEWGDAFIKFNQQGASANAFTDGDKTVYYFICRERFWTSFITRAAFACIFCAVLTRLTTTTAATQHPPRYPRCYPRRKAIFSRLSLDVTRKTVSCEAR